MCLAKYGHLQVYAENLDSDFDRSSRYCSKQPQQKIADSQGTSASLKYCEEPKLISFITSFCTNVNVDKIWHTKSTSDLFMSKVTISGWYRMNRSRRFCVDIISLGFSQALQGLCSFKLCQHEKKQELSLQASVEFDRCNMIYSVR